MLSQTVLQTLIVLFGVAGLTVALYLHYKKKTAVEGMACPMDGSCEDVITSKYSKFLGLDVEVLGMLYYMSIIVAYTIFLFTPQVAPNWFVFGIVMSSAAAVLFSAYLTYLQGVTLKMWCTWCLVSAMFSVLIMVAAVPAATVSLPALMAEYSAFLIWISVIGSAVGLGISVAYDALYLSYLKDFSISESQAESLNTLMHLAWGSVAAVALGLAGLWISEVNALTETAILGSSFVLGVIILNDSSYSLYLANKMADLTYADKEGRDFSKERQASFMLASFSTVSWTVLLSIMLFEPEINLYNLLAVYMALLGVLGLGGLFVSSVMERRASGEMPDWSPLH